MQYWPGCRQCQVVAAPARGPGFRYWKGGRKAGCLPNHGTLRSTLSGRHRPWWNVLLSPEKTKAAPVRAPSRILLCREDSPHRIPPAGAQRRRGCSFVFSCKIRVQRFTVVLLKPPHRNSYRSPISYQQKDPASRRKTSGQER